MKMFVNAVIILGMLGTAVPLQAQDPAGTSPQSAGETASGTRPATTTAMGDTGLWFVPTAEVLPAKQWSVSAYRVNVDYEQGFTDVSNFPVTFGVGLADRAELFGAWTVVRRIDRDIRPLFFPALGGGESAGVVNEYPFMASGWSGNQMGDLWLGAKVNLTSQYRQSPAAFAVRGLVKIPTADEDDGGGTGKPDFGIDAIVSSEVNDRVELSAFGGFLVRGDPDGFDLLNGVRWGVGAATPSRRSLRLTAELHGEIYPDDTVVADTPTILGGTTLLPTGSRQKSPVNGTVGLTWQGTNGVFAGAAINWNARIEGRGEFGNFSDETGDSLGFQFRIGYHRGLRVYVPPPPPLPPPPVASENRPPAVRARCEPCTVEIGRTSTVIADASDPDGDPLTYQWSAPAGSLANRSDRQTPWTAPMQEGPVPVTVTVTDGRGGTATDAVTIQVIRPAVREFVFEDVHFDFDRYSLRPEATRALDEAIKTLQGNGDLRIEIEGHTCNIGTAEYNLALGERRASAVREYLAGRGIGADRIRTVSYGEERPKHDNAREETRRLNRRAALVVRVQ
jgi:outer membrane protein OmpA-like peptidoglycan-associated protein